MRLLHTITVTSCIAFSFTPSSFGIAQDFVNVNWAPPTLNAKSPSPASKNVETALINSLVKILESRPEDALKSIDALIAENPNFRLAHLIKGDLLLARTRPISAFGNNGNSKVTSAALEDMRQEAKVRFDRYLQSPPLDQPPQQIIQMSPDQPYALLVDINRSRLYVYKNERGEPRYVTDYYISSGKNGAEKLREGDQKTPIGVYEIDANVPKVQLTDFYGPGAFSLTYPNEWDRRAGRNGHGIWLHGTPSDTYSRPPRASNGCVVLSNQDLIDIAKYVNIGATPVVISNKIDWTAPEKWRVEKNKILSAVETWRRDWESRDVDRYLSHYSKYFYADGMDLPAWITQKKTVNNGKTSVKVNLSNVNIYTYPSVENMVVVSFEQDYHSNNLSTQMKKRQYWLRENNRWRILYEGAPPASASFNTITAKR